MQEKQIVNKIRHCKYFHCLQLVKLVQKLKKEKTLTNMISSFFLNIHALFDESL